MSEIKLGGQDMKRSPFYNIVMASVGNALEWYDFIIYGFLSVVIARVFFPTGNELTSLLLALASFGVPFLVRPFGAFFIGRYADKHGRKPALTLTVGLMLLGTLIIAVTPSFESIGVMAPVLVVSARLLQGFSAGGEFGSATTFLAEQNPARRGFYGSWQFASQGLASMFAAGVAWAIFSRYTPAEVDAWAWRLPFVFGLLIGPVGLLMRRSMLETTEFQAEQKKAAREKPAPVQTRQMLRNVLLCMGLIAGGTVSSYVLILYLPTFAIKQLGLPQTSAFLSAMLTGLISLLVTPLMGELSDRIGRIRMMQISLILVAGAIIPLFLLLLEHKDLQSLLFFQGLMALLLSLYNGPLAAVLAELFPVRERSLGISLGYNLSVTLFGGFAPMVLTALISATGSKAAPSIYALFAIAISFVALAVVAKTELPRAARQRAAV